MGKQIAIVGIDGSGKTFLANRLLCELKERDYCVTIKQPFQYFLLEPFLRIIRRGKTVQTMKKSRNDNWYFKMWGLIATVDICISYFLFYYLDGLRYDFIVCDRYFYDFPISFENQNFAFTWNNYLIKKIIPLPSHVILIDNDPGECQEKETDDRHTIQFLTRLSEKYREYYLSPQTVVIKNNYKESSRILKKILGIITTPR